MESTLTDCFTNWIHQLNTNNLVLGIAAQKFESFQVSPIKFDKYFFTRVPNFWGKFRVIKWPYSGDDLYFYDSRLCINV